MAKKVPVSFTNKRPDRIIHVMRKLMRFFKPYVKVAIPAPLFKMFEAVLELFVPLVMTAIIDVGIENGDKSFILKHGLILVGLGAAGLLMSVTAQFFAAKTAVGFSKDLKSALFRHIQTLSFSELDTVGNATLINRMTADADKLQTGINMTLRLFLRSPFIVFGAAIMAFTIDTKSAFYFCVAIPLLSVIVFGIMLGTVPLYAKVQAALDKSLLTANENLDGLRVIRAFNMQKKEVERFKSETEDYASKAVFSSKVSSLLNPITFIIVNAALIAILYGGAVEVNLGELTKGELIAIVNYMSQILVELIKLADLIILLTKSLASANRISEVFEIGEER